jgi:hypothetical protein
VKRSGSCPVRRAALTLSLTGAAIAAAVAIGSAQRRDVFVASRDNPAISYTHAPVSDAGFQLDRRIQDGAVKLQFEGTNGYLKSLLAALEIPIESQTLVFSETSAEAKLINPTNPRSIYFNDTVSVGWVRGSGALEVAAQDPSQGVVFYTLAQKPSAKPRLAREDGCLMCHLSWDTLGVPGVFVLSTFPMSDDKNSYANGFTADHRSPIAERWGGWYVTGKPGPLRHMGNVPVIVKGKTDAQPHPTSPVLASLDGKFDLKAYLSPYSDIVALMVLEHQTHMTNLLTRVGWEARLASTAKGNPDAAARMREAAADLVDYLLFVDEAPLASSIRGSSGFAEKFAALGPRDSKGRSLRQLDLDRRLMKYPCSYMIYTPAFDALPPDSRSAVYQRMWQILSGKETGKRYAVLSRADRQAVVEILKDTKKDLPPYFQTVTQ